jgi:hypothetical protein
MMRNNATLALRFVSISALALATGCVEETGLINRTNSDKLEKTMFEGVWIYVQTTVDSPYSTALSFTGETNFGDASKLVFDIQEDKLVAHSVVQTIEGSESDWKTHPLRKYWDPDNRDEFLEMYVGPPIARWPITSHFDVFRSYNTYNGAQSNELVENTTDRPWYQRDYIRVDWTSQELTAAFYELSTGGHVNYSPGEHNKGEPDSIKLDPQGGYFDYVVRSAVAPSGANYCSIYGLSKYDCEAAEVRVRHAFKRVDPRRDYEPLRYHNNEHQEKFGYFLTERYAYNPDWGSTYEGKVSFANRWNLWRNSYDFEKPKDANGEEIDIGCMFDSACDQLADQRCQKSESWMREGYCATAVPRPYSERGYRPVIYHLNADWHPDYIQEAYMAADGWSDAFKDAVAWMLFYEEKGQGNVRGCAKHADCATADLLWDGRLPVLVEGIPCHLTAAVVCYTDADCPGVSSCQQGSCTPIECRKPSDCSAISTALCVTGQGALVADALDPAAPAGQCIQDDCASVAGATCGSDGMCQKLRTCSSAAPCAVGQVCVDQDADPAVMDGVCKVGANVVMAPVDTFKTQGSTVIRHNGGTTVLRDNIESRTLAKINHTNSPGKVYVRFVSVAGDGQEYGLYVGRKLGDGEEPVGQTWDEGGSTYVVELEIAPATPPAGFDYDPQDPATDLFSGMTPPGLQKSFAVTRQGKVVQTLKGDVSKNTSYVLVYNGTDLVSAASGFSEAGYGIRFVHAAAGEGPLDFGLEGVRIGKSKADLTKDEQGQVDTGSSKLLHEWAYKSVTPYSNISGNTQRATVTRGGTRGDITCHMADTIGRCVGWGADITADDLLRVATLKAELPEMFVLCSNRFDEFTAFDQAELSKGAGSFTDARYSSQATEGDGLYNPCGDPSLVPHPTEPKNIGDSRYSFMYWVNEMQRAGPLGYGPSAADPDTGQQLFASAYIYGASIHTYSQYAKDLVDLVNGDLDIDSVVTGKYVREAVEALGRDDDEELQARVGKLQASPSSAGQAAKFHASLEGPQGAMAQSPSAAIQASLDQGASQLPQRNYQDYEFPELAEYMRNPEKLEMDARALLPQLDPALFQQRLAKVKGTWVEAMMLNDEVLLAAQDVDPEGTMSQEDLIDRVSPATWASKSWMKQEEERTKLFNRDRGCVYMGEFADDAIFGLAKELKAQGYEGEALRLELGRRVLRGVLEHEVGHTVGLRHNFSGTTDVFNFFDEYYEIRERENIACLADGWCDEQTGELCAYVACENDADCAQDGGGGFCDKGLCSIKDPKSTTGALVPLGLCARKTDNTTCATTKECKEKYSENPENTALFGKSLICSDDSICYDKTEQFVPRSHQTDHEKAMKRTEYQYSTVMDYGGRFNSDIHGLGKYDYAAIRFGYGQLVDTYYNDQKVRDRVEAAAATFGPPLSRWSFYLQTAYWPNRGTGFFHAFNYLHNYIGVEQNLQRVPRPYEQIKYQRDMVVNDVRESLDIAHLEVPYAFCSDEYRGNMGCYYFDTGIDPGEMAKHAHDQLTQYYIFDAFKRERLYFGDYGSPFAYYARIMDRYLRVLGDVGMYYALWDNFLFRYSWYQEWKDTPLGGRTLHRAATEAFGQLKDIVSSPAPGCYQLSEDVATVGGEPAKLLRNTSLTSGEDCDLNVPFGVGRFPFTQFGSDLGYHYYEHPLWFGSFWEKMGALITLTDSTAYFVDLSVGEQLNIGVGTSLGFNTVFADEMNNFLGGIVSNDYYHFAGRQDGSSYLSPSTPGRKADDTWVEPALNQFTLKLYAALLGLAYLPAGFDPTFIDRLAVFVDGEASLPTLTDGPFGIQEYRFEDPIGGKTYLAYSTNYGDPDTTNVDVAAELVQRAAVVADKWETATGVERSLLEKELAEVRDILDLLRKLHHIYGTSVLGL